MQENIVNKTPVISHSLKTFDMPPNFSPSEISRQSNVKGTKIFSYDGISDVKEENVHEEEIDMDAYFNVTSSKPKEEELNMEDIFNQQNESKSSEEVNVEDVQQLLKHFGYKNNIVLTQISE